MATIAIDATYSLELNPSGIAVYSRELLRALADLESAHRFLACYRLSRLARRRDFFRPVRGSERHPEFLVRMYQEPLTFWLPREAELFHSLAQRPPGFRFQKEVVTVLDVFPITGGDYSTPEFRRKFSALLVEAVHRAARIIVPSQYTADQLIANVPVPREKIRVIPLGVELPAADWSPERRALEREQIVGEGNVMILSVGVIQTRKNTLKALEALELLPPEYRLVLAGGTGYGGETVLETIRRKGLEGRVLLLGHVPALRLQELYQAASVFLFPSREEGFGLPVLEAMAWGVPVVASRTSSLPEVGGDAVLYVDPSDPADIAIKTARAVKEAPLRESLIEKGHARAGIFPWRRTAERTLSVYEEALSD
jgi:O-antigen biosynthesis alpha-1,2-mannosyltransferase